LTYKILLHRKAVKALDSLENKLRKRVTDILSSLADYPEALKKHDTAKIKGMTNTFRIRVGGLRIIFQVDKENQHILVTTIERRAKAYKKPSEKP
jgi:mRNA interferase RelE/StbE